jgi:hypothetical protein
MHATEILSIVGSALAIIASLWHFSIKIYKPFIRWGHEIETSTTETLRQINKLHEDLIKIMKDHEQRITHLERQKNFGRTRPSP